MWLKSQNKPGKAHVEDLILAVLGSGWYTCHGKNLDGLGVKILKLQNRIYFIRDDDLMVKDRAFLTDEN